MSARFYNDEELRAFQQQYKKEGARTLLDFFFGVDAIEMSVDHKNEIRCRFDATAPDQSKEVRWVTISTENSPEENMAILADARQRQAWYETSRHEVPGIPVPQPEAEETPKLPASAAIAKS